MTLELVDRVQVIRLNRPEKKNALTQDMYAAMGDAIAAADTNPEIQIAYSEDENYYQFQVKDNGIGINPDFKNRIFVIFQRLHARTEYDGTGIGLAICQKIVQRLGGKIWVESELGNGATFFFTLPKQSFEAQEI